MAVVPVYMPKFGMTMTQGYITQWYKAEGEHIEAGDPLLAVETEKVVTDIQAPTSGVIVELSYAAETEVEVGQIVAYIEE